MVVVVVVVVVVSDSGIVEDFLNSPRIVFFPVEIKCVDGLESLQEDVAPKELWKVPFNVKQVLKTDLSNSRVLRQWHVAQEICCPPQEKMIICPLKPSQNKFFCAYSLFDAIFSGMRVQRGVCQPQTARFSRSHGQLQTTNQDDPQSCFFYW